MINVHDLARDGRFDELQHELDRNPVRVNELNPANETPLFKAVWKNHYLVAEMLLDRGTDINIRNADGRTALHSACIQARDEIAKVRESYLLELLPRCKFKYSQQYKQNSA